MSTSFGDAWKKAGEAQDDFDPPDGKYTVKIVDAGAFAGRDGREWAKVTLQIIGGNDAGRRFDHFGPAGDHNEVGLRIMREALVLYGLDPDGIDDLDDLGRAMFELVGNQAEITVGHKDGFKNIRVQSSRTGESDIPTDPPTSQQQSFAAAAANSNGNDDESIPF